MTICQSVGPYAGGSPYSEPYSATTNFPGDVAFWVFIVFCALALYVAYRVWKSLKNDS